MKKWRAGAFFVILLGLAACGALSSDGEAAGTWEGVASSSNASLTLQLTQTGATVEGTVSVGDASAVSLQGTFANALLSLEGKDGASTVNIEASIEGNSMKGALSVTGADGNTTSSPFTASR